MTKGQNNGANSVARVEGIIIGWYMTKEDKDGFKGWMPIAPMGISHSINARDIPDGLMLEIMVFLEQRILRNTDIEKVKFGKHGGG